MNDSEQDLRQRVTSLEREVARLKEANSYRCIRRRSPRSIAGWPLYDIAIGPDSSRGELRGHARGIVAVGDLATGLVAIGGLARGGVAFGGLAFGLIALGGCSIGLLAAVGGAAVGGLAIGGGAIGLVAVGGGAFGYYAVGGGAAGAHVLDATHRDPEAVRFFGSLIPGLRELLGPH